MLTQLFKLENIIFDDLDFHFKETSRSPARRKEHPGVKNIETMKLTLIICRLKITTTLQINLLEITVIFLQLFFVQHNDTVTLLIGGLKISNYITTVGIILTEC